MKTAEAILEFWFGGDLDSSEAVDARSALWFRGSDEFDRETGRRFGTLPDQAARGELNGWRAQAAPCLALVLVVDQFPRNLYRNSPRAFEFDALALEVALEALEQGFGEALHPLMASFLYLPLEHAEDLGLQERAVLLFEELASGAPPELAARFEQFTSYARRHRDVIQRFGRFPHRNALLDRPSTPEEVAYLESGGDTFG